MWPRPATSIGTLPTGGATGHVLTKNSGADYDVSFAAPTGGGGGGGRTLIGSSVLAVAAANVNFSAIPGTYTNLILEIFGRGTSATATQECRLRFNADAGANYDSVRENRFGAAQFPNAAFIEFGSMVAATTTHANSQTYMEVKIPRYTETAWYREVECHHFTFIAGGGAMTRAGGHWRNIAAAISSIDLFPIAGNWAIGSKFYLWGIT